MYHCKPLQFLTKSCKKYDKNNNEQMIIKTDYL